MGRKISTVGVKGKGGRRAAVLWKINPNTVRRKKYALHRGVKEKVAELPIGGRKKKARMSSKRMGGKLFLPVVSKEEKGERKFCSQTGSKREENQPAGEEERKGSGS